MARQRPRGWWYPWIFVAGMFVVFAANGVLAYLAVDTWSGLETDDYYRKGLRYNEALASIRAQEARGWRMHVSLDVHSRDQERRAGRILVRFETRDGQPITDLSAAAMLIRPTHEGYDTTVPLVHQGEGLYAAGVTVPLPGQWDARIHARRGDETFQHVSRLSVP